MKLPIEWYIATRYIRSNVKQSIIIALAVGMGVSIIIFIPSVNLSFFADLLNKTVVNSAHIRVTRELETLPRDQKALDTIYPNQHVLLSDQTFARKRNILSYRHWLQTLLQVPGVIDGAPYITEQIIVVRGSQSRGASLNGIVPAREEAITDIETHVQQGRLDTLSSNQVFLGWRLAKDLKVSVGEHVQLLTSAGSQSFTVSGIINTGIYAQDMTNVYTALTGAQQLLKIPNQVSGIALKLADYYQAKEVSQTITQRYGLKTRNWMEDNEVLLQQIANFKVIIGFINFLIVFASASSITSVLIMVVASKSKEIGILKSMGTTPGSIIRLFLIQAIFLSLLGSAAGVIGGTGLIALYNATPFAKAETMLGVGREPVRLNFQYTLLAIFYAMISSFLASLIPAWQAGKLDPVKAINQS